MLGANEEEQKGQRSKTLEALRHENALMYDAPEAGCLIDSRTYKSMNFSSTTYTLGDTMQCIFNSGNDAMWGPACYLRLDVSVTAAGAVVADKLPNFGFGSIMNIFRNMRLTHRSGGELEQIQNVNVVAQLKRLWQTSLEDRRKLDGLLGCYQPFTDSATGAAALVPNYSPNQGSRNFLPAVSAAAAAPADGAYRWVFLVPMHLLSGVFASKTQMIPAALLAGAKFELDLDNGVSALANWTAFAATGSSITAIRPSIVYDSSQLFSGVSRQLMMEMDRSPDDGLAFAYCTYFTTSNSYAADASLDVQQSASIVQRISAVVRLGTAVTSGAADSFNFLAPYQSYQFRIGSVYIPYQPIHLPQPAYGLARQAANDAREVYEQALLAWGAGASQYHAGAAGTGGSSVAFAPDSWIPTTLVAPGNYTPPATLSFTNGAACYAATLEKSPVGLAFSGQSTNNSRLLNIQLNGAPTTALETPLAVMGCMEYLRVARVSGDNCIVDR